MVLKLELHAKKHNLVIHGLEEKPEEELDETLRRLFSEKMGIGAVAKPAAMFRLGRRKKPTASGQPSSRPVMVRFASHGERDEILANVKRLEGTGIYLQEDLPTAMHLERTKLVAKMKEIKKNPRCRQLKYRISLRYKSKTSSRVERRMESPVSRSDPPLLES